MKPSSIKKIKEIWWPDNDTESGRHIKSSKNTQLYLIEDNNEKYIIEIKRLPNKNAWKLAAHHNPRYVESILF